MALKPIEPPQGKYVSDRAHLFSMSDIHMGNTRPTNDCHAGNQTKLNKYFQHIKTYTKGLIKPTPTPENLHLIDIIFNGDTFDFWKAVPDPSPHSGAPGKTHEPRVRPLMRHSLADNRQRFAEILDFNKVLIKFLAEILYHAYQTEIPWGTDVYILTGNHDDPACSQLFGATPFKKMLVEKVVEYATTPGTNICGPTPAEQAGYRAEVYKRIHWGDNQRYYNGRLMTHIEHGHRFDDENKLRKDSFNNKIYPAAGQAIVEEFINGLHDRSLNNCIFEWERAYDRFSTLESEVPNIDNFTDEIASTSYFRKISSNNTLVKTVLSKNAAIALYQMGNPIADMLFDNPVMTNIGLFFKKVMKFGRSGMKQYTYDAAKDILNQSNVRIVSMGHSHLFDTIPAAPVPAGQTLEKVYVNTATFVDLFEYKNAAPWKKEVTPTERPILVHEKFVGAKRLAYVWIWDGNNDALWFRVDLH